jgi:hypothetical protein
MKRKGAYEGQLLSLEGTYELSAKAEIVRVADSPECIWDHNLQRAIVTKARGKHLHSIGVWLRRQSSKTTDKLEHDGHCRLCIEPVPAGKTLSPSSELIERKRPDPTVYDDISNPAHSSGAGPLVATASSTHLFLYPEEVLLLVEQGSIVFR